MRFLLRIFSFFLIFSCSTVKEIPQAEEIYSTETLKIIKYSDHVYQHISYLETKDFGKVDCNGMILLDENETIIFDTPVDHQSSQELLYYIENELNTNVNAVIATHFHADCIGGLDVFHQKNIPSFALDKTLDIIKEKNEKIVLPTNIFSHSKIFEFGKKSAVATYLGEGHTQDNIVGYFTDEKVLFGGCLVKSIEGGKGNLADANTVAWPKTIKNLKKHYGHALLVIPGHGKAGNSNLLNYTQDLFNKN